MLLAIMLIFTLPDTSAYAAGEATVRIESIESKAATTRTGDLLMEDTLSYRLDGEVESLEYVIDRAPGESLPRERIEVYEWRDAQWIKLEEDVSGAREESGFFSLGVGDAPEQRIRIFLGEVPPREVAYLITYRLENLAVRYDDFARLTHRFVSKHLSYPVESGTLALVIPESEQSMVYRFGAGEQAATEAEAFTNRMETAFGPVAPGEGVMLDVFFDPAAVPGVVRFEPGSVRPILRANDAVLEERRSALGLVGEWPIMAWYVTAGFGLLAVAGVFYSIRHQKLSGEHSGISRSPIARAWLIEGVVTPRGLNATLIDFMRRGLLDAPHGGSGEWRLRPPKPPLFDGERLLYDFLERRAVRSDAPLSAESVRCCKESEKRELMRRINGALKRNARSDGYGNLAPSLRWLALAGLALLAWAAAMTLRAPGLSAGFAMAVDVAAFAGLVTLCLVPTKATRELRRREQENRDRLLEGRSAHRGKALLVDALVLRLDAGQARAAAADDSSDALIDRFFGETGAEIWLSK